MEEFDRQKHWEKLYQTKQHSEVSWYQPTPLISISYFELFKIPKEAKIIDVGGGDSFLVDNLLDKGYKDITVLDISNAALERAKLRLGEKVPMLNGSLLMQLILNPQRLTTFGTTVLHFTF
jgi:2-polyprenyl-3-methyl-5-hydroxy-6-metoxy-1,4-benzoquinol methylase